MSDPRRKLVILSGGPLDNQVVDVAPDATTYKAPDPDAPGLELTYTESGQTGGNLWRFSFAKADFPADDHENPDPSGHR